MLNVYFNPDKIVTSPDKQCRTDSFEVRTRLEFHETPIIQLTVIS